jgi:phosphoglycerate kinase
MSKLSISDLDLTGRRVFMRVAFNVPIHDGVITEDARIQAALPSIRYVVEKGGRLILASHLGRPKGKPDLQYTLQPVAKRLSELLGKPVGFAPDCVGPAVEAMTRSLRDGDVMLLENLRFHAEEEKRSRILEAAICAVRCLHQRRIRNGPSRPRVYSRHYCICASRCGGIPDAEGLSVSAMH